MEIKDRINSVKNVVVSNKKIIENYFFMTILQVLNSFFYLLIYPYLIRVLGIENYGVYVLATSVAMYFTFFVNFGFDMLGVKAIVENANDVKKKSDILSCIFTAKTYLFLLSLVLFVALFCFFSIFNQYKWVFISCFVMIFTHVLFPQWYFQGIQKMRTVTFIQLGMKLMSLPFIFFFVKSNSDLDVYSVIVTFFTLLGGIIAFVIVKWWHNLSIHFVKIERLKIWFTQGRPFFYSSIAGALKDYSIPLIISHFFGMRELAIYDLANKIVAIPRVIFMSVNAAIFPKLVMYRTSKLIKKIVRVEAILSFIVILGVLFFGKIIIQLMGGGQMLDAYPLSVLLSITILTWMVVGAYINFVFIPNGKNYLVTHNQIVALLSFLFFSIIALLFYPNILGLGLAMAISGVSEIVYCRLVIHKYKLLV